MKLLVWTQYFWPEHFGINALATALRGRGVDVAVLTGKPNYPEGKFYSGYRSCGLMRENFGNIEVMRIPLRPRGYRSALGLMLNYLSFVVSGYVWGPWILRGRSVDAVLVYAPSPLLQALPAIFVAWLKRAPLILWVQDIWPEALSATGFVKNRWILQGVEWLVRYIYRHSDAILIQSEGFRPSVERRAHDREKIQYYPNAAEIRPPESPSDQPVSELERDIRQHFSIVFAGNIGIAQSCETIVEAAEWLRDRPAVRFYLVGSGSQAPIMAQLIANKGLDSIVMIGAMPAKAMPSLYAASSVLLLSLRDDPALSATIPSKLQSYLTAAKPIIACMNGEGSRIVRLAGAGLSCPAGDARALAEAVLSLYHMPRSKLAALGENGRKYARLHFDLEARVSELVDHVTALVQTHGSG